MRKKINKVLSKNNLTCSRDRAFKQKTTKKELCVLKFFPLIFLHRPLNFLLTFLEPSDLINFDVENTKLKICKFFVRNETKTKSTAWIMTFLIPQKWV